MTTTKPSLQRVIEQTMSEYFYLNTVTRLIFYQLRSIGTWSFEYGPSRKNTCLRDFLPGRSHTILLTYRDGRVLKYCI